MVPYDYFLLFLDFAWFLRPQEQSWGEGVGWSFGGQEAVPHTSGS